MRFVDDDAVVAGKKRVVPQFGKQNTVGHEFEYGFFSGAVIKTHLTADLFSAGAVQLLRQTPCHCGRRDTARLCTADHAVSAAAEFKGDLRQLGGFAGTGFAADDDEPGLLPCRFYLTGFLGDRQ